MRAACIKEIEFQRETIIKTAMTKGKRFPNLGTLTTAIKDIKAINFKKMDVFKSLSAIVSIENNKGNLKGIKVCRHVSDNNPFISIGDYNKGSHVNVLAIEYVQKNRSFAETAIRQLRKILGLMIDNPGSLLTSDSKKDLYKYGAVVFPNTKRRDLIDAMSVFYFELLGIYTMLQGKQSDLLCICRSNIGVVESITLGELYKEVHQEHMKPVLADVKKLAENRGIELTEDDRKDLISFLGSVLNGHVGMSLSKSRKMNSHEIFMVDAKELLLKKYGS